MKSRQTEQSQDVAAAKSGVSVRSGRRIERGERIHVPRTWRTREDPLGGVWETHLVPYWRGRRTWCQQEIKMSTFQDSKMSPGG